MPYLEYITRAATSNCSGRDVFHALLAGTAAAAVTSSSIVTGRGPEAASGPPTTAAPAGIARRSPLATAAPHLQCKQPGLRPPRPAAASQPRDEGQAGQASRVALGAAPLPQDGAGAAAVVAPSRTALPPLSRIVMPPPVPRAAVTRFRRRGASRLGTAARAAAGAPPTSSQQQPTLVLARGVSILSWRTPGDCLLPRSCQAPSLSNQLGVKAYCSLMIRSIMKSCSHGLAVNRQAGCTPSLPSEAVAEGTYRRMPADTS